MRASPRSVQPRDEVRSESVEITSKKFKVPRVKGLPATRRGAIALALVCALAAAVILLVALSQYKKSVSLANREDTVLVATGTIQQGTAASVIAQDQLYKPTSILVKNLAPGAIVNAAALQGEVAQHAILPGQQLTTADFAPAARGVVGQLTPGQRAVSLALDSEHGLVGEVEPGDHVDVYGDFGGSSSTGSNSASLVKMLIPNALVLKVPSGSSGLGASSAGTVVLAVSDTQVGALAYAAENGKVWLALRPGDASSGGQGLTTYNSVVFGR
jgi:Flp pilus assembly protein CpaB